MRAKTSWLRSVVVSVCLGLAEGAEKISTITVIPGYDLFSFLATRLGR